MAKTRHIQKRMSQRGIKESMVELVKAFGVDQGDKSILNRKGCDAVLNELEQMKKDILKIRERGGLVLIENGEILITTYALNSYSRKLASNDEIY